VFHRVSDLGGVQPLVDLTPGSRIVLQHPGNLENGMLQRRNTLEISGTGQA
jgi:hypothetical protein